MPYMVPKLREMLANDKENIADIENDALKSQLLRWLDSWVSPEETLLIDGFYNSGLHPLEEWLNYSTPESVYYDSSSDEQSM